MAERSEREGLLVAAARAVVLTIRESPETGHLPGSARAVLRLLEAALAPYDAS